jgi:hypothetical protein
LDVDKTKSVFQVVLRGATPRSRLLRRLPNLPRHPSENQRQPSLLALDLTCCQFLYFDEPWIALLSGSINGGGNVTIFVVGPSLRT